MPQRIELRVRAFIVAVLHSEQKAGFECEMMDGSIAFIPLDGSSLGPIANAIHEALALHPEIVGWTRDGPPTTRQ